MNTVAEVLRSRHAASRRPRTPIPAELAEPFARGKLSQSCEPCGIREAASFHCSKCGRRSGPPAWFLPQRSEAQNAASRAASHAKAERRAALKESAKTGVLA
jgi:hypothetical protein